MAYSFYQFFKVEDYHVVDPILSWNITHLAESDKETEFLKYNLFLTVWENCFLFLFLFFSNSDYETNFKQSILLSKLCSCQLSVPLRMKSIWVGEEEEQEDIATPHGTSLEHVWIAYKHPAHSYMLKWLGRARRMWVQQSKLSSLRNLASAG